MKVHDLFLKGNISMEKNMEKEKNIIIEIDSFLKGNISVERSMEKGRNLIHKIS